MESPAQHLFLSQATSLAQACQQVENFLHQTELVRYESFTLTTEQIVNGTAPDFWPNLERGVQANEAFSNLLLSELQATGVSNLNDLLSLRQGYPSKLLHILTHMLDGFIGIDSAFYNLIDDSHSCSEQRRQQIKNSPESYWLIPVQAGQLEKSILHP